MNTIGDFIDPESSSRLMSSNWNPGDVYGLRLNEENGITPHGDDIDRYKYFIILGQDKVGNIYGGVVINSKINSNLRYELKLLHYPLDPRNYPFLRKNSFVNCVSLIVVKPEILAKGDLLGHILDEDLNLIKDTVVTSGLIPLVRLRQFGLIES